MTTRKPKPDCELCTGRGQTHDPTPTRCQGHSSQNKAQCRQRPMAAMSVCQTHGGRSPQAKAKREREQKAEQLQVAVRTYGAKLDVDPAEAMLDEVRWTAGHVAWLREQVQQLEAEELAWGRAGTVEKQDGPESTWRAAPHVLLDLYAQERRHLVAVCRATIVSGIEERQVRLAERQGDLLVDVITRIVNALEQALRAVLGAKAWQTVAERWPALVGEIVPRELLATGRAA